MNDGGGALHNLSTRVVGLSETLALWFFGINKKCVSNVVHRNSRDCLIVRNNAQFRD